MTGGNFGDGALAAHQAAEVRHVIQERQTEEQNLQDAWSNDADVVGQESERVGQNGSHDDLDGAESDVEGATDDDMMDRISSSPSIDDGAYSILSPTWPERSSSLMSTTTAMNATMHSTSFSSPLLCLDSQFPLFATDGEFDSPASTQRSSSPFTESPQHLPLQPFGQRELGGRYSSKGHHLRGEYLDDDDFSELYGYEDEFYGDTADEDTSMCAPSIRHERVRPVSLNSSSATLRCQYRATDAELHDENGNISDILLPPNDPLLLYGLGSGSVSPTDSSDSWATATDSFMTGDEETDPTWNRDDDTGDLSLYSDERFVDSGWGGECLRDTEDIDFDFVYALHTFVATVEGQANATKGDTMVLLDDTNSYWWLVRVVKDSSIGKCGDGIQGVRMLIIGKATYRRNI